MKILLAALIALGGLAVAPSPAEAASPAAPAARALCARPTQPDQVACMAYVREDIAPMRGLVADPAGYGPADLTAAYNLPGTGGEGQTVAVVVAYDNPSAEADLAVYRQQYGLPPCTTANGCFTKVDQRGGADYPWPDAGWAGEAALDLDMVSAVCPRCNLLLVEADSATRADMFAAVDTAVALGAKFVSNSWGGDEFYNQAEVGDPHFNHPGVAITVATGDWGYGVAYPSSSPYVTAVGGTSLARAADSPRGWAETAWSGTGSGCSLVSARAPFEGETGCPRRAVSDVAAVADPYTGVAVYHGGWQVFGGTSAAAPIVAGVYALNGAPLTGSYPNALPAANPSALHDVTAGSNGTCPVSSWCAAGPGWDGPTGLGTPNGLGAFGPGEHGTLVGAVTDAATGEPLRGVTVTAGGHRATTGVGGRYAFTLPPGDYRVAVEAFGYHSRAADVTLADGQTATMDLALTPQPRVAIAGTLLDGAGHGWPVQASVGVAGQPSTVVRTDPATGAYRLSVPAGAAYSLDVTPLYPGYQAQRVPVEVGDTDVTVDLRATIPYQSCEQAPGYAYRLNAGPPESFDAGALPAGWRLEDGRNRGLLWRFDDPGRRGNLTGGGGAFAIVDSDNFGSNLFQDTRLIAPVWNLTGTTHPVLSFRTDYYGMSNSTVTVEVTVNGGTTWQSLWRRDTASVRGPATQVVDLTAYAGQAAVQVRFRYQGYNAWWWQVDDVGLGERSCAPTPGGLVVGRVLDKNTRLGLPSAAVVSDDRPAERATSTEAGAYWFFSSATGERPVSAALGGGYRTVSKLVRIKADAVTAVNFPLPAGRIAINPDAVAGSALLGGSRTVTVTAKNTGSAPATLSLHDVPGSLSPLAGAGRRDVPGEFSPKASVRLSTATATAPFAAPWTPVADYPMPIMDNAMAASGGTVYSVGGLSTNGVPLDRGYAYQPGVAAWTRLPDLAHPRHAAQAAVFDGRLHVTGGWNGTGGAEARTEIYDPATGAWTAGADVPAPRAGAATAVLGSRMFVVGGCPTERECGSTDVQVYDPATGGWDVAADYPRPTSWLGCGAIGQLLYCAGGISDQEGSSRDAYAYDPATDRWSPVADAPADPWGMAYTAANGRLLLSGGVVQGSGVMTNAGWAYDPATDSWSALPNANTVSYRAGSTCGFYRVGGAGLGLSVNAERLPGYGDCAAVADVSWLRVDRDRVTLGPGDSVTLTLTLDAGAAGISQPGRYTAALSISEDTPYPHLSVPVGFTVNPPVTWGKLTGAVTGTRCDGATVPVPGATVAVRHARGTVTLRTDAAGRYQVWLDARDNPLDVVVGADGWAPTGAVLRIVRQEVTTRDFTLASGGCG